jgi:hypothetical protein
MKTAERKVKQGERKELIRGERRSGGGGEGERKEGEREMKTAERKVKQGERKELIRGERRSGGRGEGERLPGIMYAAGYTKTRVRMVPQNPSMPITTFHVGRRRE